MRRMCKHALHFVVFAAVWLAPSAECVNASFKRDYNTTEIENFEKTLQEAAEAAAEALGTSSESVDIGGLRYSQPNNSDYLNVRRNKAILPAAPIVFATVCNNRRNLSDFKCTAQEAPKLQQYASITNNYGLETGKTVDLDVAVGKPPFDFEQQNVEIDYNFKHGIGRGDDHNITLGEVEANQTSVVVDDKGNCSIIMQEFNPVLTEWGFDWVVNTTGQIEVTFNEPVAWNAFKDDDEASTRWYPDVGMLVPTIKGLALSKRLDNVLRNHTLPGAVFTGTSRLRVLAYTVSTMVSNTTGTDCEDFTPCHRDEICNTFNSSYAAAEELARAFLSKGVRVVRAGEKCGPGKGMCTRGLCCSAEGKCSKAPDACGTYCKEEYGRCDPPPNLGRGVTNFPSEGLFMPNATSTIDRYREGRIGPRYLPTNTSGVVRVITGEYVSVVEPGGLSRCGIGADGNAFGICSDNECCSSFGYCGSTKWYCSNMDGCQEAYGACDETVPDVEQRFSDSDANGPNLVPRYSWCGPVAGDNVCIEGQCCGPDNRCNSVSQSCFIGCQPLFGDCKVLPLAQEKEWEGDHMLCGKWEAVCPPGFCCGRNGTCSRSPEEDACGNGCQWEYGFCNNFPSIAMEEEDDSGNSAAHASLLAVFATTAVVAGALLMLMF